MHVVRRATEQDLGDIVRLSELWASENNTYGLAPNAISDLTPRIGDYLFVAYNDSQIVGYIMGTDHVSKGTAVIPQGERYVEIEEVYVHPDRRSAGIGHDLVDRLLVEAESRGDVAKTTLSIPYPYPDGAAETWIASTHEAFEAGRSSVFGITDKLTHRLIGCMTLRIDTPHRRAELAYWLGKPYWGKGYTTEAARRVVGYGFDELRLNRIWAAAFVSNPASSAVMRKVGMKHEGVLRQHVVKWDEPVDVDFYGVLRTHYCK